MTAPPPPEVLLRWMSLAALVLLAGAFAFVPLIMPSQALAQARARAGDRRRRLLLALLILGGAACALDTLLGAAPALPGGRYGLVMAARVALWLALAGLWAARRESAALVLLPCALLLLTQSAASRSALQPDAWPVLADWLHLTFTAVWFGGVAHLALVDSPVALRDGGAESRSDLGRTIDRFSPWAVFCVLGLAVTGLAQSAAFLTGPEDLWTTVYGRALSAKLAVFAGLIGFGAFHQWVLAPKLRAYRAASRAAQAHVAARRFGRSVAIELAVSMLALLAAAVMVSLPAGSVVSPDPAIPRISQIQATEGARVGLGVSGSNPGTNPDLVLIHKP